MQMTAIQSSEVPVYSYSKANGCLIQELWKKSGSVIMIIIREVLFGA